MRISATSPVVQIGALVLAFAGGVFVGGQVTKRKYSTISENEIVEAREYYKNMYEPKDAVVPTSDVEQLVLDLGYVDTRTPAQHTNYNKASTILINEKQEVVAVVEAGTVVVVPDDGTSEHLEWDYEFEVGNRTHEIPYNIHQDEFENASATGNSQIALTFYEEDDVLVDESNSIVDAYLLLGEDTLRFGHGAKDPNTAYVRNEKIGMDFEITLVRDSYAQSVLGLEPETELKHSHQRRGRRSRDFD